MLWAREAMKRWRAFDEEWGRDMRLNLFHTTGDLMFREDWEPFLINTKKWWDKHQIPYQVLDARDVAKEFPVVSIDDINVVMYEPNAGVVRARRACSGGRRGLRAAGRPDRHRTRPASLGTTSSGRISGSRSTPGRRCVPSRT